MEIKRIIKKINNKLTTVRRSGESLEEYLNAVLEDYKIDVSSISKETFIKHGLDRDSIVDNIQNSNKTINDALIQYSTAHIVDCITTISDYINNNEKMLILRVNKDSQEDKKWYRMRNQEKYKRLFPANEMFHIPFQLRGKVNTQRYSLPGYPCLYISRSIWATWEEMHEPQLSQFCVSLTSPFLQYTPLSAKLRQRCF